MGQPVQLILHYGEYRVTTPILSFEQGMLVTQKVREYNQSTSPTCLLTALPEALQKKLARCLRNHNNGETISVECKQINLKQHKHTQRKTKRRRY